MGTGTAPSSLNFGCIGLVNGDTYDGQFKSDKKHERGKFSWGDGPWKGHEYDGEWNMDRMEGKGEYITAKNSGTFFISNGNGSTPSKGPTMYLASE